MKKKLLVMYARYGSGHKAIAEYVANYIKENNNKFEVKVLDITEYGNVLGKIGVKFFEWVGTKRKELLFDFCYELMDHKLSSIGHNSISKRSYDNKKLKEVICDFNPDVVISSHFYCSNIITYYNNLKIIKAKLLTVITDYWPHEWWTRNHRKETGYIVGNEMVKEELIRRGIDGKKVYPFGLPLNINQIGKLDGDAEILKRYQLKGDKDIYLFFGGSSAGSMYYFDYFKAICKLELNVDIIFICGNNEKLKRKCDKYISSKEIKNIKVLGYSKDVLNIMKIADLVISKPGGATVTECLEMKVPMLIVPGLGGQEKYNARFISRRKYGIKVRGVWAFKRLLKRMQSNPNIINKMHERMLKLDNNKSVEKINDLINKM